MVGKHQSPAAIVEEAICNRSSATSRSSVDDSDDDGAAQNLQSLKAPVREKGQASAKNRMPEQNAPKNRMRQLTRK